MTAISQPSTTFQGNLIPKRARLIGWAALVRELKLDAPVRTPSALAEGHVAGSQREEGGWRLFDKRYGPGETPADHLTFALRHEHFDPLILKRACEALPKSVFETMIRAAPTGALTRRLWFFYETFTGRRLDLEDATSVTAVDALDPVEYVTATPLASRRHRVRNNLLGGRDFCPVIRRTDRLKAFLASNLAAKAEQAIGKTGNHLLARAASFLLLADSRASFEIEGERPPRNRLERWGRAIMQAGKHELSLEELARLQAVLIEEDRFIQTGLRTRGVYVGERDIDGNPLPEFIGARASDLESLMEGLIASNARMRDGGVDPVLQAAATSFGFVYIHPYEDGNGRLHRCLIHHVLAERRYTPPGLVFPVSSVMADRIDDYRQTLQSHSGPLMDFIDWRPTADRNVEVLNDTADLYRFFDATAAAEFLYACVQRTVEEDLPKEIDHLRRHDEAKRKIQDFIELPDMLLQDLMMFLRQNDGKLPRKRREREFEKLTDEEVARIEAIYAEAFAAGDG